MKLNKTSVWQSIEIITKSMFISIKKLIYRCKHLAGCYYLNKIIEKINNNINMYG